MRRLSSWRMAGFVLLPVILAMSLIAAIAFMLNRDNGLQANMLANSSDLARARYIAEAGLQAVNYKVQSVGCSGTYPYWLFNQLTDNNFAGGSYTGYTNYSPLMPSVLPTTIYSTGTYNGTSVKLTRNNLVIYQPGTKTYTLQPNAAAGKDTYVTSYFPTRSFGSDTALRVWQGKYESLLQFDLSMFPAGSRAAPWFDTVAGTLRPGAELALNQSTMFSASGITLDIHPITRSWVEGTNNNTANGASWNAYDGVNAWPAPGIGYDAVPVASSTYTATLGWKTWDLTGMVNRWLGGLYANNGLWLRPSGGTFGDTQFVSSDDSTAANRPKLSFNYLLACGATAPNPPKDVLFVVKNAASLSSEEANRKALFEAAGLTVDVIDDDDTQANFNTRTANSKAAYVSQEALASSLGSKLTNTPIGVVNENKDLLGVFGFATLYGMAGGLPTLQVDATHFITTGLSGNLIVPYVVNEWSQIVNIPVAAGVIPVGKWATAPYIGRPALMALPKGAALMGSGTAAGCRVQIPWGSGTGLTPVKFSSLSADAKTIMQRAVAWAGDPMCAVLPVQTTVTLSVVADSFIDQSSSKITLNYGGATGLDSVAAIADSRVLFRFDTSTIPVGATIISATLRTYVSSTGSTKATRDIWAHTLTESWGEGTGTGAPSPGGVTSLTRDGSMPWTTAGGTYNPTAVALATEESSGISPPPKTFTSGWLTWNLTPLAQGWIDGVTANNGVILINLSTRNEVITFESKESATSFKPQLVITYQ